MIRGILLHVLISVFVASLLGFLFGHISPIIAGASLAAGFLIAFYSCKWKSDDEPKLCVDTFFGGTVFFVVCLIVLRHSTYLFYEIESHIKTLNANNYGDLTMHIGILKNIASGDKFWPEFVSLSGHPLQYPFGVDLYNALWEAIGVPTQTHLYFTAAVLLLCLAFTAYWWLGIIGVIAIFFNGGWQGYEYIWTGMLKDYQGTWAWKNFFLTLLIPQRGFLIGLPIGIYILKKCIDVAFTNKSWTKQTRNIVGFMWAMLPIFHMHSFVAVSLILGSLFLVHSEARRKVLASLKQKDVLAISLTSFVIAMAWILPLTGFLEKASIIHIQKGWNLDGKTIWQNLFWNYGPWFYLCLYTGYVVIKKHLCNDAKIFFVGLAIFIVFQFVMMAPWEWDNIKILIWPYLLMVYVMGRVTADYVHKQIQVPLLMVLGFSGFVCVIAFSNAQNRGHSIYSMVELNAIQTPMKEVPLSSVFAALPTFNHALTYFGKKVAYAYDGHIWSHGLKDGNRKEKVEKILKGDSNWKDLAKEMGITHIYWGPREKEEFKVENQPWRTLKNISLSPEVAIYAID